MRRDRAGAGPAPDGDLPPAAEAAPAALRAWRAQQMARAAAADAEAMCLAFQASPAAMIVTDAHMRIVAANPAYERLTGCRRSELVGTAPSVRCLDGDAELPPADHVDAVDHDVLVGHRDGGQRRTRMSWARVAGARGQVRLHVATFTDPVAGPEWECQLWRHRAHHDPLTGLPNRHYLESELARGLARASRHRQRLALLFIDLDGFKSINDGRGHAVGDRLIRSIGLHLRDTLRAVDFVARYGGDEFVAVLEAPRHAADAGAVAAALLSAVVHGAAGAQTGAATITASIGVALYPDHAGDAAGLLKVADEAMYCAKRAGGNAFAFGDAPDAPPQQAPVAT